MNTPARRSILRVSVNVCRVAHKKIGTHSSQWLQKALSNLYSALESAPHARVQVKHVGLEAAEMTGIGILILKLSKGCVLLDMIPRWAFLCVRGVNLQVSSSDA